MMISMDLLFSVAAVSLTFYFIPNHLSNAFCKDVYSVGISVLSIIFSVFFTALAIIMSSSSDEFVTFLEEKNYFSLLLWGYKITIGLLLVALLVSLSLYSVTSYWLAEDSKSQQIRWFVLSFEALFLWSLAGTASSVFAAIQYAFQRSRYLQGIKSRR